MKTRFFALILAGILLLAVPASAAGNSGSFRYYDQLDSNQKSLYNMLADLSAPQEELALHLPDPIAYTSDSSGNNAAADRRFSGIAQGALDALLLDDPSLLWINKSGTFSVADAYCKTSDGKVYNWKISDLTLDIAVNPDAAAQEKALQNALFDAQGETRYEQVKYLHDRLCQTVVYSDGAQARTAYGALVEGKAVCEGYSKAFKLLCDRAGIPCVIVTGTAITSMTGPQGQNHMWNYVQMEDGKWYAVDATWDDQPSRIHRDFFLVGKVTLSTQGFGKTTFAASHIPNGNTSGTGTVFAFPELSERMYRPQ